MNNDSVFDYKAWPWLESSDIPKHEEDKKIYPKLSVVIPSFNQGEFIEETIRSVIYQNYPNLELIIIDGGSKDNTVEIIKKYEKYISYWVSESDNGQSHAINKGLQRANGDWVGWINSDDCYLQNAFQYLFVENNLSPYEFLYGNYYIGEGMTKAKEVMVMSSEEVNLRNILCFFYGVDYIIPSQSVFVKRDIIKKAGLLNESLHYCMDVEWYARIFLLNPKIFKSSKTICFFRFNSSTKTSVMSSGKFSENKMAEEAESIALQYSKYLGVLDKFRLNNLFHYYTMYSRDIGRHKDSSIIYLIKVVIRHPFQSFKDRRLLGLIKRKIFRAQDNNL